jgi:hypothetical protein
MRGADHDRAMANSTRVCRSCEGRGWRLASRRRELRVDETAVRLVGRACPECSPSRMGRRVGHAAARGVPTQRVPTLPVAAAVVSAFRPSVAADVHRTAGRRLFRRACCVCGLAWPCLELRLAEIRRRPPEGIPDWNGPTQAFPQIGRAGQLTLAQEYRAGGGKRATQRRSVG